MVHCKVRWDAGKGWAVRLPYGLLLWLVGDWGVADFAVDCGVITAPDDWSGNPYELDGWFDFDPEQIQRCPDKYMHLAE